METMVSSSNNTQKVIFLWQKLIWSKQPEGLLSTKSFIVISTVVFFIMTLRNGEMYYNNLLSGFLTILLTIISGIIFGKGLEILFRTLHIWSGAYGNVVFSLADIFISLLFGCIFVIFGPLLLFNKKLYKLLRLLPVDADKGAEPVNEATAVDGHGEILTEFKTAKEAELAEKVDIFKEVSDKNARIAKLEQENENLSKILTEFKTAKEAELAEMKAFKKAATENELQTNLNAEFEKMMARIKKIVGFIQKIMDGPEMKLVEHNVKILHLKDLKKPLKELEKPLEEVVKNPDGFFQLPPNVIFPLQFVLDFIKYEEKTVVLEAIIAGLEAIITEFEAYKAVEKVKLKAVELEKNMAKLAAAELNAHEAARRF
ncbi:hypothetical protein GINT2_001219 [Glugoides intestinalis]